MLALHTLENTLDIVQKSPESCAAPPRAASRRTALGTFARLRGVAVRSVSTRTASSMEFRQSRSVGDTTAALLSACATHFNREARERL